MGHIKRATVFLLSVLWLHFMATTVVAANPQDLPEVIQKSIEKMFPGSKLTATEQEKWKGKQVTEVELVTSDGVHYEVYVSEDGTIQKIEEEDDWGWFSK